jgi:hypothetical protein
MSTTSELADTLRSRLQASTAPIGQADPSEATIRLADPSAARPLIVMPPFKFGLDTVAVENGDYDLTELGQIVSQPRVNRAAVDLYRQAGSPPAILFGCDIGHLKAIAATFRIDKFRAVELNDFADVDACRAAVADLSRGAVDVVVAGRRLAGSTSIPGLRAIILLRPTQRREAHQRAVGHCRHGRRL